MSENSRRQFLKVASVSAMGLSLFKGVKASAAATPMVDPKEPQAKALGYVLDASKQKPNPDGSKKLCRSCLLYTKAEGAGDAEKGKCSLFPNKMVMATAVCNSYAKKG